MLVAGAAAMGAVALARGGQSRPEHCHRRLRRRAGETPLLASFMGSDTPQTREKFLSSIPLGRFSTPKDIAATALYLASDEAAMITGVALEVDGGRCI